MSTINKQLVGSLLVSPSSLASFGSDGINLAFFDRADTKLIKLAYKFYEKGVNPTESNISGELDAEGFNNKEKAYALSCMQHANNATLIETYETIAKTYKKNELVRIATEFVSKIEAGEDVDDASAWMQSEQLEVATNMMQSEEMSLADQGEAYLIELRERYDKERDIEEGAGGVPTGVKGISLKKNMRYDIGARPGNYKTATAISFARNISDNLGPNELVVMYTAEMSQEQLYGRMSSSYNEYSGIEMGKKMTLEKYNAAEEAVRKMNERHGDTLIMKSVKYIEEIELHVRSLVMQGRPPAAIFIDYVQLLHTKNQKISYGGNTTKIVEYINRKITELKKLTCVVALSQFNREVDSQPGSMPHMGNFANSSSIEKDSDLCLGAYKPSKYGVENDPDGNPYPPGVVILINMKDRHGQHLDHLRNPMDFHVNVDGDNMHVSDYVDASDFEDITPTFQMPSEAASEVTDIIKPERYEDDEDIPF